jgi:hypothetical protein
MRRRRRGFIAMLASFAALAAVAAPAASADSITLSPASYKFAPQKPGGVGAAATFTLTVTCTVNCGPNNPGMTGLTVATTGEFPLVSHSCPSTFITQSTNSCTILVAFAPTGKGLRSGSLTVSGTAFLNAPPPRPATYSASLTGVGGGKKKCKKAKKGAAAAKKKCGKKKKK